jgi:radical SAM protein with 4Fe4S-binding SPASM domain
MPGCRARQIHDPEFTREEIEEAARGVRLLAVAIELGRAAGLRRPYRSAPTRSASKSLLSPEEVRDVILQARELGARKISILTGEPTEDRSLSELRQFMSSHGLEAEISTGGGEIAGIARDASTRPLEPSPPSCDRSCMRHKFSCLVRWQGDVMPCAGLDIPIGNVREQTLHEIIKDSEVLEDLRDHIHTIKGPCASCEEADRCYGCRGAAYWMTGDYLASDPLCWRNAERQDEIARLPMAASEFIPQQLPMRVIDDLVRTGERSGEVSATVSDEMPFLREDGVVDEVAYFEIMAQSIAAVNGFKQLGRSASSLGGYLVGARNFEILGRARIGDKLNISVYKHTRLGNFGIVVGSVSRNDTVLARGEIKIWQDAAGVPEPAHPGE